MPKHHLNMDNDRHANAERDTEEGSTVGLTLNQELQETEGP